MPRKRHRDEDIQQVSREVELSLTTGSDLAIAWRTAGVSDATNYTWPMIVRLLAL